MKHIKINVITIIGILFLFLIISNLIFSRISKNKSFFDFIATPTPVNNTYPSNYSKPLTVISQSPVDQSIHVSTTAPIKLTFNNEFSLNDVQVRTFPDTPVTTSKQGTTLSINPSKPLQDNKGYFVFIYYQPKTPPLVTTFSTGTPPANAPDNSDVIQNELSLYEQPDIYLYNRMPYENNNFSVTAQFEDSANPHYFFIVTLQGLNKNASKQAFITWLHSLGMEDLQIQLLDIRYQ
jgi:Big-like domain-containing protein